jgi:hypothetical protein
MARVDQSTYIMQREREIYMESTRKYMYGSVILRRNDVDDDSGGQDFAQTNADAVTRVVGDHRGGVGSGSWKFQQHGK